MKRLPRWARGRKLTDRDRDEVERLADYLRRVGAAIAAGVPRRDAQEAIYPDIYPERVEELAMPVEEAR